VLALALRNLLVRKARTTLSLVGLTVAIVGIIALISVSRGIQALLQETISLVPGITVLAKDVPSLAFSSLPAAMRDDITRVEGVGAVVAQVWHPAFEIEGENLMLKGDPFNMYLVLGVEAAGTEQVRDRGPILRGLREGRELDPAADEVLIPRAAAEKFSKKAGEKIRVLGRDLDIVGIFHAGSLFFDRCIVVPLRIARAMAGKDPKFVSSFYVELREGADPREVAKRLEAALPVKAWTTEEVTRETASLWRELDVFLLAIASIAVLVGGVGIVNTMLMSVMERTGELGVLRATGWRRRDVIRLILIESSALGAGGGVLGCAVGWGIVALAGTILPLRPVVTPALLGQSFALALVLGALGGLYPAWRAANLDPMEAIRS
jgi:putative ABC transport system permease protein